MRIAEAISYASGILLERAHNQTLIASRDEDAKREARLLLSHVLNVSATYLYTWPERELTDADEKRFLALIERRAQGEPVAYITGQREFWSLNLKVSPATLIPRPETELLVELALANVATLSLSTATGSTESCLGSTKLKICDLGTGTGAIALALACELPNADITAIDCVADAVTLARDNAKHNKITNVTVVHSHWFDNLEPQQFDMIVSNPPYVEQNSPYLHEGDVRFEPKSALTAGEDGLDDIRIIARQSQQFLALHGVLLLEHGTGQSEAVRVILAENGYCNLATHNDLAGHDRVTLGFKSTI